MSGIITNFAVVLLFIIVGGFFAAAELALVSLRDSQVEQLSQAHPRKGGRLKRLIADPNRFLAAVQVGVTLAGFLSAGFGAAQIAPDITPLLISLGLGESIADPLAFVAVTVVIAYLSLVLGELVPKRLALQRTEGIALNSAAPVDVLAKVSRPFIWWLSVSTNAVVRILGGDPTVGKERMSREELRGLVQSHEDLPDQQRELIDDVFAAGERELREVMIPRTEVQFLDHDLPVFQAVQVVRDKPHSRYPVFRDSTDDVIGFVHVRDLLDPRVAGRSIRVGELIREAIALPGSKRVLPALAEMRDRGQHLAIVVDEYGGTDGIVTLEDLVEELVGEIHDEYDEATGRRSNSGHLTSPQEIAGLLNLDEFADEFGMTLPEGPYETVAGFVLASLGRLPEVGDTVRHEGCDLTVLALDRRRIDRILVAPLPETD